MSHPPNGTSLAPRARWAASRGECERVTNAGAYRRRPTYTCSSMAVVWQGSLLGSDDPRPDAGFGTCVRTDLAGGAWIDVQRGWLAGSDTLFADLVDHAP